MKSLFTLILGFLCLISPSYAQQENTNIFDLFVQNELSTDSSNELLFICRASNDDNTTEHVDLKSGILIDYDNNAYPIEGNYNIKSDEMQILLQNKPRVIFPQKIKAIKVGEMVFAPCEFEGEDALTYGYFQVLSSSKIDLLKRFETDKGMIVESYYVRKEEEVAKPIKLNKGSLLKYLDDSKTSKFLKERKLNIKNEQDLIVLFNYYNGTK